MEFMREFFYDEVQEGFYVPGIIKRAWGAQLKVLGEIDKSTIFSTKFMQEPYLELCVMALIPPGMMM